MRTAPLVADDEGPSAQRKASPSVHVIKNSDNGIMVLGRPGMFGTFDIVAFTVNPHPGLSTEAVVNSDNRDLC